MLRLDLFTCNRTTFDQWCQSLLASDSITRGNLEIAMPGFVSIVGADPADLGLLQAALSGLPTEAALAGALDAVEAVSRAVNDPGRSGLVLRLRDHAVRTFGETLLGEDRTQLETWWALANIYHEVEDSSDFLTAEIAAKIRTVCAHACDSTEDVYAHAYVDPFYGLAPPLKRFANPDTGKAGPHA